MQPYWTKRVIYARAKLVCDKIGVPQGNLNKNTKPRKEIRLEGKIKKMWQQMKVVRNKKHARIYCDEKIKTKQQTRLKIQLIEIDQKILGKEGDFKDIETASSNISKTEHFKITKENSINKLMGNWWSNQLPKAKDLKQLLSKIWEQKKTQQKNRMYK